MRSRGSVWCWLSACLIGVLLVSGCGSEFPSEDDVPEEAFLAFPGAELVETRFVPGRRQSNVDGGVTISGGGQGSTYTVSGVSQEEVREWYRAELADRGWTLIDPEEGLPPKMRLVHVAALDDFEDRLHHVFNVRFYVLNDTGSHVLAEPGDVPAQISISVRTDFLPEED